jgi:hypothetical protein
MKIESIRLVRLCCVCDTEAAYQCVECEDYFCTTDGCRQRRGEQHHCVRLEKLPQKKVDTVPRNFEVKYWFNCPACLKQTVNTIAITADISSDARELAIAGLSCEHCHKELPKGYFVHTTVTEMK